MTLSDKSPRTSRVSKSAKIIIVAIIVGLICSVFVVMGHLKYRDIVNKSSTPIGTSLTFPRSQVDATLKNLYVDKNSDVMIARIKTPNGSELPYKGTDYKVYLNSKSLKGHKSADILFGRMSTDGDLFLVIPKPKDEVYNVFIMNKKFLGSSGANDLEFEQPNENEDLENSTGVKNDDYDDSATKQSISKALSSYQFDQDDPENSTTNIGSGEKGTSYDDIISFRITKDPAFKDKKYMPKRINADLLNSKNEFDYEKFFDVVFKNAIIKDLEQRYTSLDGQLDKYEDRKDELESRLNDNPDDGDAKSSLETLKTSIESVKDQQDKISNQITEYSLLEYNNSYFKNMNKKATIIDEN